MVREETYKKTYTLSFWWCMSRYVDAHVWCSKEESKTKVGYQETKPRQCRTIERNIFFIEPNDEEFKLTIKAARRKLEVPMPATMACKIPTKSSGETHSNIGKRRTRFACVVDADERTRPRVEGAVRKSHQDHITAKGMTSMTHYSLVHKVIPMPQAMKIPNGMAAVVKECEKLETIPAWQLTKGRNKKEVIDEARNKGRNVHFASLMDLCHLKNSELEPQYQKYKGRVVLRGEIVKDDSGAYAAFTEQGSSASQMTAAKVMDILSTLPGCSGQTADAVSAKTKVKKEDASSLFKIPKSECPDIWIRLPKHKWAKSRSSAEDPVVPLERNLHGHPLAGLQWERQFEKVLSEHGWEQVPQKKDYSSLCMLTIYNWQAKQKTWNRLGKFWWKTLIWKNQPHSSTHVCLGCTQRECTISHDIVTNYRDMFEARISAGDKEKLPTRASGKLDAEIISSWWYDMEGPAKQCVERNCELANKTTQQLYKSHNAMYGWPSI